MTKLELLKKAIIFLRKEIEKAKEKIEKAKEDLEWYELTGESRIPFSFGSPQKWLDFYKGKLHDKKTLLERSIKRYEKVKILDF